jgi:hypothetical protein
MSFPTGVHMKRITISSIGFCVLAACAAKAPPNIPENPDNPDAADPGTPDGSVNVAQTVSGKAMDYFGAVALQDTAVATDGIDPPVNATSATDGAYTLQIPIGSKLYLTATHMNYRPTRNAPISVADMAVSQDVYIMSNQDVRNQYTVLGKQPTVGTSFFAADLIRDDGTPLVGIIPAAITLIDGNLQPVPGVLGPYFFGAAGSIDPALATATAYGTPPRSRVAFLDVPPGTYTLRVNYSTVGATILTVDTPFASAADGATITVMGAAAAGAVTPPPMPSFATDIYPRLQKAANGGLGCANCHTAGGPGAVLVYDDPAALVLTNIKAIAGVVDLATPASSLLLTKPLYELPPLPQNHENATFLSMTDPDYQLFLLWITQGAKP